jgi:hypothetical protein
MSQLIKTTEKYVDLIWIKKSFLSPKTLSTMFFSPRKLHIRVGNDVMCYPTVYIKSMSLMNMSQMGFSWLHEKETYNHAPFWKKISSLIETITVLIPSKSAYVKSTSLKLRLKPE